MYYCLICERNTNVKRHYGVGTVILILVTVGWWILALPFYKKRCTFCKGTLIKKKVNQKIKG